MRATGFTLLELIVGVALFAIVTVIAYSGLAALYQAEEGMADHAADWGDLQLALQLLETDLSQAVDRPVRDPLGGTQAAFILSRGSTLELGFSRLGAGILSGAVSQLQRVEYLWDGETLRRRLWPHPDRVQGRATQDTVMLDDLKTLDWRFRDSAGNEHTVWPPAQDNPPALPALVELSLEHPSVGPIRRLLLVQP